MDGRTIAVLFFAVIAGALGLSLYRRRGFIANQSGYRIRTTLVYVGTFLLALHFMPADPVKALLIALLVFAVILVRWRPRHSRYISRRDRRKVIAQFEKQGRRYDPKKHEIDHVVPHSRGGMSTADNLKVTSRARNRSKGARSTWWDVLRKK